MLRLTLSALSFRKPLTLAFFTLLAFLARSVLATPATLSFAECSVGNAIDASRKINISTVYGQIVSNDILGRHLNLTAIGNTGQTIEPISNDTSLLSTIFTSSSILSFDVFENSTFFCTSLRPPSPLPDMTNSSYFYCPVAAGPIAFSAAIPLRHDYDLLTINTRLRIVDTSSPAIELACIDVPTTPLNGRKVAGLMYGDATIIFWVSVALCFAYWVFVGVARIVGAWDRGGTGTTRSVWSRLQGGGYILASAISGERFTSTPALLRFCTPSMRDVFFHTQWCAILGLIAVQWPTFAYPMLAQTAWSTLLFNVTLAQGGDTAAKHWYPLRVQDYNPPSDFADQLNDPNSPIFVDANAPNSLLMLPEDSTPGLSSMAAVIGLRPQDLFGVCLVLFLAIIGGVVLISLLFWGIDLLGLAVSGDREPFGTRSPGYMAPGREDKNASPDVDDDGTSAAGHRLFRAASIPLSNVFGRKWLRFRIKPTSFHGSILHGNLVRVLILFHLPITIFSSWQFTNAGSPSSTVSVVLAAFSFAVFSVGIPVFLVVRLYMTTTNKLYDETRTLMMLGPLYNHYAHGSQLFACIFFANNLIYGLTIGCGQKSGTTQAIIILVTEIAASLSTSIWLPWGRGATMGLISFFFCVARITVAVLLVILTPTVAIGITAGSWIAAAILFILGLMYLALLIIFAVKVLEALIRIIGRVPFDRSRHTLDSGLLGVMGLLGWCTPRKRRRRRNQRRHANDMRSSNGASPQQFVLGNKNLSPPSSSRGPPSVLRPEHALLPYREDSDDESGYIMGSWQPFPQSGSGPADERATSPPAEIPAKSGFARVGGGRANYDSPFAIAMKDASPSSMTKHEFPSVERVQASPVHTPRTSTPTNKSTVTVNHPSVNHPVGSGLPPGAMNPAQPHVHVRTRSQVAIIEDASALFNLQTGSSAVIQDSSELVRPHLASGETDDSSADVAQPKRTLWNKFRRIRRMSEGGFPAEPTLDEGGGRSFVVLRDKKPSPSTESPKIDPAPEAAAEEGRQSFVVLRGNASGDPSSGSSRTPRRLSQT